MVFSTRGRASRGSIRPTIFPPSTTTFARFLPVWVITSPSVINSSTSFMMTPFSQSLFYARTADHLQNLIRGAHARHARKDPFHQRVVRPRFVSSGAGVSSDNNVVIEISRGEYRRRNTHVRGAPRYDDRIDAASPQSQIQIGLVKSAPTV